MIGYLLAIIPLFIFVGLPISRIFGDRQSAHHHVAVFNESFVALDEPLSECPKLDFGVHILAREPLVIYLEGFLNPGESRHLVRVR